MTVYPKNFSPHRTFTLISVLSIVFVSAPRRTVVKIRRTCPTFFEFLGYTAMIRGQPPSFWPSWVAIATAPQRSDHRRYPFSDQVPPPPPRGPITPCIRALTPDCRRKHHAIIETHCIRTITDNSCPHNESAHTIYLWDAYGAKVLQ